MLEIINLYLHGFVAVPLIGVCKRLQIFADLERGPVELSKLTGRLSANSGYCRLFFRGLHALGWVESGDYETYAATERCALHHCVPDDLESAYQLDYAGFLAAGRDREAIARWLNLSQQHWNTADGELQMLLDGALMVPLLLQLAAVKSSASPGRTDDVLYRVHADAGAILRDHFQLKGWASDTGLLNERGRNLVDRALTMAVTASYQPLLLRLADLLLDDPRKVLTRDADGHETYVDRTLNVIGSGFQHGKYFNDALDLVLSVFDREPLQQQPHYIVDMGCGDGTFLKTLYSAIAARTLRGRHLQQYPLKMIGVDFNERSLLACTETLRNIPHRLLHGDIARPQKLLADLLAAGVRDKDEILHVRTFLDHDRPLGIEADAKAAIKGNDKVYVDVHGRALPVTDIEANLRTYLHDWAEILGRHGLILVEVFALPVPWVRRYFGETESFSFDFYHALSRQALVEAGVFHQALASAGLYPRHESLRRYPKTLPVARIVLQHIERKPYRIRLMNLSDVQPLLEIDRACWPAHLQISGREILNRWECFPEGQLVIEHDGAVAGVLYTLRIDDLQGLLSTPHARYTTLHTPRGRYWQLLGISVHPDFQSLALGDRLLEHTLDLAALTAGIEAVYGVTRCLEFRRQSLPLNEYIRLADAQGRWRDPLLRFHQAHGATVEGVVPHARPEDTDNEGAGVLIRYEPRNRMTGRDQPPAVEQPSSRVSAEPAGSDRDILTRVAKAVRQLMKDTAAFAPERPLKELGLDSMSLMELRLLLNSEFPVRFEPAFFFSFPTAQAIATYIRQQLQGEPAHQVGQSKTARAGHTNTANDSDVAIIGMALRLPGGIDTPTAYWELLKEGRCSVAPRPIARWSEYERELAALGTDMQHIHRGGFLQNVDRFDAAFFHITPLEARSLDPQQRLLLELAWEALESAGLDPDELAGGAVGTFLGAYTHDYETLSLRARGLTGLDPWFGTGTALATAAGRIAYFFDFRGPTLTLDTACSSASSAICSACQSLIEGSAQLALTGAVNLMLSPVLSVAFARAGMLSIDGLCKTFDAGANGYVRSEAAAVLLLKRLDEAIRDGDPIRAVIKSAVLMQDGRTNGLTAPNGQAQIDVIRAALHRAGRDPGEVSYVEAHGTGTLLGDPVEMQSLRSAYCTGPSRREPLQVGSVKTNLGHTEAASGMMGVIKVALALEHQVIPPHLHLNILNGLLGIDSQQIAIPTALTPWPRSDQHPRVAGVSSFGFSGSNTHIILEEPPQASVPDLPRNAPGLADSRLPAVISAKTAASLRANILALDAYLQKHGATVDLPALSRTLTLGRAQHAHRAAFTFTASVDLRSKLNAALHSPVPDAPGVRRRAFLFSGELSAEAPIGRELTHQCPAFREHLQRCADVLQQLAGIDLFEILWGTSAIPTSTPNHAATVLFCVQYSLALYLHEAGIQADVVVGEGVGEVAAACYARVLSLESALRLMCWQAEKFDPANPADRSIVSNRLEDLAAGLPSSAPEIIWISTVTGSVEAAPPAARHWRLNAQRQRETQRARAALFQQNLDCVIEVGPGATLPPTARAADSTAERLRRQPMLLAADKHNLAEIFSYASQQGAAVRWRLYPHQTQRRLYDVPTYSFERQSYWIAQYAEEIAPLELRLDPAQPALAGHVIAGVHLLPASAYMSLMLDAARTVLDIRGNIALFDLQLERMLPLPSGAAQQARVTAARAGGGRYALELRAPGGDRDAADIVYARAMLEEISAATIPATMSIDARLLEVMGAGPFYEQLAEKGYAYSDQFRGVRRLQWRSGEVLALIDAGLARSADGYAIPPGVLDSCLQTALAGLLATDRSPQPERDRLLLPFRLERLEWLAPLQGILRVTCRYHTNADELTAQIDIHDADGRLCCAMSGLRFKPTRQRSIESLMHSFAAPASLLYDLYWQNRTDFTLDLRNDVRRWVIIADEGGYATALAREMQHNGALCSLLTRADCAAIARSPEEPDGLTQALTRALQSHSGPHGIVYCRSLDPRPNSSSEHRLLPETLRFLQFLSALPDRAPHLDLLHVKVLTRGAQTQASPRSEDDSEQAALWGLVSAFQAETSHCQVSLIDVDPENPAQHLPSQARWIVGAASPTSTPERPESPDHFALRADQLFTRALRATRAHPPLSIDPHGCYVISGGRGGLGRLCCEFLHARGAGRILLLSRRTATAPEEWILALNQQRAGIEVLQCDLSNEESVNALSTRIRPREPIKGVIHAAGILEDAIVAKQTAASLEAVYRVKVDGARSLVGALPVRGAEFVWLFSSVVGLFGGGGQANYAAANAGLDGLAQRLRSEGIPATAIHFGPWRDTGMLAHLAHPEWLAERLYVDLLEPLQSEAIFSALLGVRTARICVARWRQSALQAAPRLPLLLRPLVQQQTARTPALRERFLTHFFGSLSAEHPRLMKTFAAERIAAATGLERRTVLDAPTLTVLGLDSLMAVAIQRALSESLGKPLKATLLFDHPTLDDLSGYLLTLTELAAVPPDPDDLELGMIERMRSDELEVLLGEEFVRE